VVAQRRAEDRHDRDITLAHNIASLTHGSKGLPKLETLLSKRRRRSGRQTAKEQVAMWQFAAASFGGQFKPSTRR
jgi:hypothetical protein